MERDANGNYIYTPINDFNSHAHVERDAADSTKVLNDEISTHTLTWSVTMVHFLLMISIIFQLTRSRGA